MIDSTIPPKPPVPTVEAREETLAERNTRIRKGLERLNANKPVKDWAVACTASRILGEVARLVEAKADWIQSELEPYGINLPHEVLALWIMDQTRRCIDPMLEPFAQSAYQSGTTKANIARSLSILQSNIDIKFPNLSRGDEQ